MQLPSAVERLHVESVRKRDESVAVPSKLRSAFAPSADRTLYRLAPTNITTTRLKVSGYIQVRGDVYALTLTLYYDGMIVAATSIVVKVSNEVKRFIDSIRQSR